MSSTSMYVPYVLSQIPSVKGKTVLDVGCGRGKWGFLIRIDRQGNSAYLIGLDIFRPYLEESKDRQIYDDYVLCDATHLPCKDSCSDVVLACEILEHLKRQDGYEFLGELERVCRWKILITTPSMFVSQCYKERPSQVHQSVWTATELRQNGYDVFGIGYNGPLPPNVWGTEKFAFGLELFMFRKRKNLIARLLALCYMLVSNISFFIPSIGVFLIAVKERNQKG